MVIIMTRERFHQSSNGIGKWAVVKATAMNNLARDVDVVEVIKNHNSDVKVRVAGRPVFKDGKLISVGEE